MANMIIEISEPLASALRELSANSTKSAKVLPPEVREMVQNGINLAATTGGLIEGAIMSMLTITGLHKLPTEGMVKYVELLYSKRDSGLSEGGTGCIKEVEFQA